MVVKHDGLIAVIGCCLAISWPGALTFGYPGVMACIWQEMFGVGRGPIGNVVFFMLLAVGVFMFLSGRLQERYGLRKVILLGVVVSFFSVAFVSKASSIEMVYLWAVLSGVSCSLVYIPSITLSQLWFSEMKGLASGTVSMVFGLSAAVASPLLGRMLIEFGYERTNLIVAALILAFGLLGGYLARPPERFKSHSSGRSGTSGRRLGPGTAASQERTVRRSAISDANPAKEQPSAVKSPAIKPEGGAEAVQILQMRSLTVRESLHTRSFWFLWLTWMFAGAAGVSMTILSTSYGLSLGLKLQSAILILTAFNLTNGIGRLLFGFISDRFNRNRLMSATFLVAGIAYLFMPGAQSLAQFAVLAGAIGLAFGTMFAVSAPLVLECYGVRHFGSIFGLAFAAYGFVAGPLGPALSGYILDITGDNYMIVFCYLAAFYFLSAICILQVVPPK